VDVRDCSGDADRDGEEPTHGHRRAEQAVEGLTAEVLEDQGRHPLVGLEGERLDDGRRVEQPPDLVLALQLLEILRPAAPRIEHLEDDRALVGVPPRTMERGASPVRERLDDHVRGGWGSSRELGHCGLA
jgi:hypothetical protein